MAKFQYLYNCHEVQVDENDDFVKDFETCLPHSKMILDEFCKAWNEKANELMLKLINKECDNRIQSCLMRPYRNGDNTTLCVEFVARPGKQLTGWIKDTIVDFMSGQMCDGWGEGMFGLINVYDAPDGTRFYVD